MEPHALAALCGALVGLVLAFTGAGGGVIAVPLLVFALHLPMREAAPVSLIAVGAGALVGAVMGWRDGALRYRAAALIGTVGCVVAPIGVRLAQSVPTRPLMLGFAVVLVWTAWRMSGLRRVAVAAESTRKPCLIDPAVGRLHWNAPCAWALGMTGGISGLLTGLLGVGGGFVIVPSLTRFTDLGLQSIVTTSLGVITIVSVGGVVAASRYGSLPIGVALPFATGCLTALAVGRRVAPHLPAAMVQRAFSMVCVGAAALLSMRALGLFVG
jgi:hypothetical protein